MIASSEFTLGPAVNAFENKFAAYVGMSHCIATNNGTDALILALKALGVGNGDEVITVCNSFYATPGAIVACGAKPVFVDCDERYQIDISRIEEVISARTKVIMPVHWAGASPDVEKIMLIATKYGLEIVEDACMGIGASIRGRKPGTFGRIGAFSMHPLKSLNVMGDGGMVGTNDDGLATWLRKYRNHGMVDRDHIEFWGVNMRLQPLQAVVASHGLEGLQLVLDKRSKNAAQLDCGLKSLAPNVVLPERPAGFIETQALYMGLFDNRDKLLAHLRDHEIEAKIHYPVPLHLQVAAKSLNYPRGSFPVAERQASRLITLPVHQFLSAGQIGFMVDKIAEFYR